MIRDELETLNIIFLLNKITFPFFIPSALTRISFKLVGKYCNSFNNFTSYGVSFYVNLMIFKELKLLVLAKLMAFVRKRRILLHPPFLRRIEIVFMDITIKNVSVILWRFFKRLINNSKINVHFVLISSN